MKFLLGSFHKFLLSFHSRFIVVKLCHNKTIVIIFIFTNKRIESNNLLWCKIFF